MNHHTEEEYRHAIELLVIARAELIGDEFYDHDFEWGTDGDGWNEPESDWAKCFCEQWEHPGWIQRDPQRSDRPDIVDMVFEWVEHINRDVYKIYEQEEEVFDGDLSQDTNFIQTSS